MWYRVLDLQLHNGLKPIENDSYVIQFVEDVKGFPIVDIYVEHLINTPL